MILNIIAGLKWCNIYITNNSYNHKYFNMKIYSIAILSILLAVVFLNCTKKDQVVAATTTNTTDLVSYKTSSAPVIDGTIDAIWDNAAKLEITPAVPDAGNGLFAGYIGQKFPATLRSMYDGTSIYFLAEVPDDQKNIKSSPWYFNTTTKLWAQEPTAKTFDANGVLTREGFGEDKFAMLWNVDNSTPKFSTQTCYASCHVFTPYLDYSVTPAVLKSNAASGNHYTNGADEKIDMWWGHPNRGFAFNKMDDNYQDWAGGPAITNLTGGNGNGRHFDDLVVSSTSATWPFRPVYTADATQGSISNRQSLKLNGTGTTVTVPLWVIPNSTDDFIKASDTLAGGAAVKITAISSDGVLTFADGTIDPNSSTDYQRLGSSANSEVGAKCFPGNIVAPVNNGRADIDMVAIYTGTGWIYEYKRLLKTNDVLKQDIDFSSLEDQPFGFAIWDKSNYQHGIQPNLMLKFQK